MQTELVLAIRRSIFAEIPVLDPEPSLTMGHRVGTSIENAHSYGVSLGIREAFHLAWPPSYLFFCTLLGCSRLET